MNEYDFNYENVKEIKNADVFFYFTSLNDFNQSMTIDWIVKKYLDCYDGKRYITVEENNDTIENIDINEDMEYLKKKWQSYAENNPDTIDAIHMFDNEQEADAFIEDNYLAFSDFGKAIHYFETH